VAIDVVVDRDVVVVVVVVVVAAVVVVAETVVVVVDVVVAATVVVDDRGGADSERDADAPVHPAVTTRAPAIRTTGCRRTPSR
jgi:hypothetical protein